MQEQIDEINRKLTLLYDKIDLIIGTLKDTGGCKICGGKVDQVVTMKPERKIDSVDPSEYKVPLCKEHLKMMGWWC